MEQVVTAVKKHELGKAEVQFRRWAVQPRGRQQGIDHFPATPLGEPGRAAGTHLANRLQVTPKQEWQLTQTKLALGIQCGSVLPLTKINGKTLIMVYKDQIMRIRSLCQQSQEGFVVVGIAFEKHSKRMEIAGQSQPITVPD